MSEKKTPPLLYIFILIALAVGAVIVFTPGISKPPDQIVIAGKDSFESSIAMEMIAIELEKLGIPVERRFSEGVTNELIRALNDNNIHLYPDYTGTFLSEIIKDTSLAKIERNHTFEQLNYILDTRPEGKQKYKILHPAKRLDSSYEMVMLRDSAESLLGPDTTLTGLSRIEVPESYEFGFSRDFDIRIDAEKALSRVYGLDFPDRQTIFLHHSRKYEKLLNGQIQIADGYSTDEEFVFRDSNFVFLVDDKNAFPHYYLIPIVREELLTWYPPLEESLQELMNRIDLKAIAIITGRLKAKGITVEMLKNSDTAKEVINSEVLSYYNNR